MGRLCGPVCCAVRQARQTGATGGGFRRRARLDSEARGPAATINRSRHVFLCYRAQGAEPRALHRDTCDLGSSRTGPGQPGPAQLQRRRKSASRPRGGRLKPPRLTRQERRIGPFGATDGSLRSAFIACIRWPERASARRSARNLNRLRCSSLSPSNAPGGYDGTCAGSRKS
jgi:hypothetical protein